MRVRSGERQCNWETFYFGEGECESEPVSVWVFERAHKQSGRLLREGGLSGLFQNGGGLSRTSVGFGLLESSSKWSFVSSWLSFSSQLAREEPSQPGTPTWLKLDVAQTINPQANNMASWTTDIELDWLIKIPIFFESPRVHWPKKGQSQENKPTRSSSQIYRHKVVDCRM